MMRHKTLMFAVLTSLLIAVPASVADAKVTDEDVRRAIEKAKEYLLSQQNEDGSWDETSAGNHDRGITALTMCTLTYIGMHPNRPSISKGIQHLIAKPITAVYPLSLKIMALSYVQNKLIGQKRQIVRKALVSEAQSLYKGQRAGGGWHYGVPSGSYDFSCTQLAVLGLREAALAGVEIPAETFREVQGKYYKEQCDDGGWTYTVKAAKGAAAMTYAGLASIYITSDNLMLGMGCPYLDAKAREIENVNVSHMDPALRWVQKNFSGGGGYAGYALERVGVTSGYKYLGKHDWYREIAESLVKSQKADGSWGGIINTCFNTMFLYKGRAPVLFNKLQFKGKWRIHRRDIANLTKYIIRRKEQPFHWQVVNLDAAVSDLHDAPVLYISTPHAIDLTEEGKRKLRA
ncbi:MAG: prenyltransferase/squalene oxidase repeat-containing protein, partial [Phycisphaerae bacterium]|nr:prenyltransferase/squalene oxidase repeat-containing protein [Phycisphaerae bacterium]